MSYIIHIPIDDISESDLEADLREVARVAGDESDLLPPILESEPRGFADVKKTDFSASANNAYGESSIKHTGGQGLTSIDKPVDSSFDGQASSSFSGKAPYSTDNGGGFGKGDTTLSSGGLEASAGDEDKTETIFDLAKVRQQMEDTRNKLVLDTMSGPSWTGDNAGEAGGDHKEGSIQKDLSHQKAGETKSDDDVSKRRNFVNSLKKEHQKELTRVSTTPRLSKDLEELMPDSRRLDDEENRVESSLKDFSEDNKFKKYKHVKQNNPGDNDREESRPYDDNKKTPDKGKAGQNSGDAANQANMETDVQGYNIKDQRKDGTIGSTTQATRKRKDKRLRKHKKAKQGHAHSLESEIHNAAVARMIDEDVKAFRNETAEWRLMDSQRDRVDIPLTESSGAWIHKVHGRRDIVVGGSIVMALGVIVILVGLFAIARRRFGSSTRRKTNVNNNKRYRRLGTASETEILRGPQRSLFPLESSSEEATSSEDETIYHQKSVYRNF